MGSEEWVGGGWGGREGGGWVSGGTAMQELREPGRASCNHSPKTLNKNTVGKPDQGGVGGREGFLLLS